jgi:hypothetical protein
LVDLAGFDAYILFIMAADPDAPGEAPRAQAQPQNLEPPPRPPVVTATGTGEIPGPQPGEIWSLGNGLLTFRILQADPPNNTVRAKPLSSGVLAGEDYLETDIPLDFFLRDGRLVSRPG